MRKSTFLWLSLAALCGATLFHTSQKIHDAQEKLDVLERNIVREDESIRVLAAEWGYLNQPDRLEKLAREYLGMEPLKGNQIVSWNALPARGAVRPETPPAIAQADIEKEPKAPKIKIQKPAMAAVPPAKKRTPPPATSVTRNFGDVMKSLGFN